MQAKLSKKETLRLIRSLKGAFDDVRSNNDGKRYNVNFMLTPVKPWIEQTDSQVASLLEVFTRVVNQFAESDLLQLQVDVVEFGGVDAQIQIKTKDLYDASKALEDGVPEATQEASVESIEEAKAASSGRRKK